jgi:hypothetical protein
MDPVLAFFSRNEKRAAGAGGHLFEPRARLAGAATPFGPLAKIAIEEGLAL